jgi:hypothetical protein
VSFLHSVGLHLACRGGRVRQRPSGKATEVAKRCIASALAATLAHRTLPELEPPGARRRTIAHQGSKDRRGL